MNTDGKEEIVEEWANQDMAETRTWWKTGHGGKQDKVENRTR